jgi:hypothetical protein
MHFANRTLSCNSCNVEEAQERKRHREIATMVLELKKLVGEISVASAATLPVERAEGTPKREWKAIKKASQAQAREQITTEADVSKVAEVLYHKGINDDDFAYDDSELNEALSIKFQPVIFTEKRLMDKLMMPPKRAPRFDEEAVRCAKQLGATGDGTRPAQELVDRIHKAITADIEKHYRSDCELRKRRVIYAQWVSKGVIMAEDYDVS